METTKRNIRKHLFICTNQKVAGECCGLKNSQQLLQDLKQKLRDNNQYEDIRVSGSSCLGPCAEGITAVLYPNNDQITQLKIDDIDALYALLIKP